MMTAVAISYEIKKEREYLRRICFSKHRNKLLKRIDNTRDYDIWKVIIQRKRTFWTANENMD